MKTNKIINEILYRTLCRNYVVRTHLEKESTVTALTLMLKEASKNAASVINGTYKGEIGQKMQTLDKIGNSKIGNGFIHRTYYRLNDG